MKSKINQGKVSAKRKKFRVWEGGGGTEEKIRGIARPPTPKKQHKNGIKRCETVPAKPLAGVSMNPTNHVRKGVYI